MDTISDVTPQRVLAITDDDLTAGVRRAAAAANREVLEHPSTPPRRLWVASEHVVVDAESAQRCAEAALPRRSGVHLVCPGPPGLPEWRAATAVGAESVLGLADGEAELVTALARRAGGRDGRGPVLAVVGGRGGAGASTLAAALALTVPMRDRARRSLLVDCDVHGGGLDLLVGAEHRPGLRWPALLIEGGAVSAAALHAALPGAGERVSVLSCGRGPGTEEPAPAAVTAVVDAGRAAGDVVVCDVPRHSSGVAEVVVGLSDVVVVVIRAQVRAVAAAETLLARLRDQHSNVVAVVRGPSPGGLRGEEIADLLGLPVLATMRPEPGLAVALEHGGLRLRGRSPLRRAAATVLDLVTTVGSSS